MLFPFKEATRSHEEELEKRRKMSPTISLERDFS